MSKVTHKLKYTLTVNIPANVTLLVKANVKGTCLREFKKTQSLLQACGLCTTIIKSLISIYYCVLQGDRVNVRGNVLLLALLCPLFGSTNTDACFGESC